MSLFVAIPFAYFFTESEGFAGSRKVTLVIHLVVYTLLDYMYLLIIVNAVQAVHYQSVGQRSIYWLTCKLVVIETTK